MLITDIELQNVKSFEDAKVSLSSGVNAVCGANGSGKSTLVEAVGFALFNSLPYNQSEFVREGKRTASITVTFVDNLDDRPYCVVRKCGHDRMHYVHDPETGMRLVEGADTIDWLKEHLRVEPSVDLASLFTDAVGVGQGLMAVPFLETPAPRRKTFDPLLQVEEYEHARARLRESETYVERLGNQIDVQIAGLDARVSQLPAAEQELAGLTGDIVAAEGKQVAASAEVADVSVKVAAHDEIKLRIDQLAQALQVINTQIDGLARERTTAESSVQTATAAAESMAATAEDHRLYLETQNTVTGLRERQTERLRLDKEFSDVKGALALARQESERCDGELKTAIRATDEAAELDPLVRVQESHEVELQQARLDVVNLENAKKGLADAELRLNDLSQQQSVVALKIARLRELEMEIASHEERVQVLSQDLASLRTAIERDGEDAKQLQRRAELLTAQEEPVCPVCKEQLAPERAQRLADDYCAQVASLRVVIERAQSQLKTSKKDHDEANAHLRALTTEANELPRDERLAALGEDLRQQVEVVGNAQAAVEGFAGAPDRVNGFEMELKLMNDPRGRRTVLLATAGRRDSLAEDLCKVAERQSKLVDHQAILTEGLLPFAGLDERLNEAELELRNRESGYRQYLANAQTAAALVERQRLLAEVKGKIEGLVQVQKTKQNESETVATGYDEVQHANLTVRKQLLDQDLARLGAQLDMHRSALGKAQKTIEDLRSASKELEVARAERAETEALHVCVRFVRQMLKEAGPLVTRALVHIISAEAARYFAEIIGDHTPRLNWDETYEVTVERQGRPRSFRQLSGGEQMVAALSVRLALLKEMSGVDVAFFDEPTANLDGERRDNLADQLARLSGFGQLIVISHDDAFERITEHVVRLRKDDGVSVWVNA